MMTFDPNDKTRAGCYSKTSNGNAHQVTRRKCAAVIEYRLRAAGLDQDGFEPVSVPAFDTSSLHEEATDGSDEHAACDWLNAHAALVGHSWGWRDGDFGLWPAT